MGLFGNFFEKKNCDFCGEPIGLLGNRKLEDGNMCKSCASKLSPWFSERRKSTKADIQKQMQYREENKREVAQFHATRTLGINQKVLIDEDNRKFMVTDARDLNAANPDVLDYSQVTGCDFNIDEHRTEKTYRNKKGEYVNYVPPRYDYSYSFEMIIHVNHPYFNEIKFNLGYNVDTGERAMGGAGGAASGINFRAAGSRFGGVAEYEERVRVGNEIKTAVEAMRKEIRKEIKEQNTPKTAALCPFCGATTIPDANGCCEYCGSALNG